jgi:hypothetical protein
VVAVVVEPHLVLVVQQVEQELPQEPLVEQ